MPRVSNILVFYGNVLSQKDLRPKKEITRGSH